MKRYLLTGLLLVTAGFANASDGMPYILKLPALDGWEKQIFEGETSYSPIKLGNRYVLKADSQASASGLIKHVEIDLNKTPYMNWSWKIESAPDNVDEKQKSGDDYAARVYVIISDGFFFWQTRAISYVWASNIAKNTIWPNAFTEKATMVAIQSGDEHVGQWMSEKRNVLHDVKALLGSDVIFIISVAIMTDTDNSKQSAVAYYGDIFFTEK